MKWEFTSWGEQGRGLGPGGATPTLLLTGAGAAVPLVSKVCPSDVYRVWKRGESLRVDTTLLGFEHMTWQRGRRSYIFKGEGWLQHPQTLQPPPRGSPGTRALHAVTHTDIGSPTETPDAPWGRGRLGAGGSHPCSGHGGARGRR